MSDARPSTPPRASDDPPHVTLFVLAYKQEDVVREAIESAFAQTYPNLEIILSDDGSPDGTFRVMQEMAAAYDGPHRVILNRNQVNLGIARHLNAVLARASGALLVQNAGDDVSRPDRVARLVELWREGGRQAVVLYSAATLIDPAGRRLGRRGPTPGLGPTPSPAQVLEGGLITLGAASAWSRRLFDAFGPLNEGLLVEDLSTTFRAACLGPVAYLDEELVGWRTGGLSWNPGRDPGWEALYGTMLTYARWRAASYRSVLKDLEGPSVGPVIPPRQVGPLRAICRRKLAVLDHQIALADAPRIRRPALALRGLFAREAGWLETRRMLTLSLKYGFDFLYRPYLNRRLGKAG